MDILPFLEVLIGGFIDEIQMCVCSWSDDFDDVELLAYVVGLLGEI